MTRDEIVKGAVVLIEKVEEYSPKTGAILNAEFAKLNSIGCASTLDQKTPAFEDSDKVLAGQIALAKENLAAIENLSELVVMAGDIKCGG